jgi:multiple sugar transport system permease protein
MSQTLDAPVPVSDPIGHGKPPKRSGSAAWETPRWLYAVLAVGLVVVVVPFLWMLVSSFKPEAEVRAVPPTWWPETVTT